MRWRIAAAVVAALVFAGQVEANDKLVASLKTLGKAVDNMSANISKAESDTDAELLANATRQATRQRSQAGSSHYRYSSQRGLLPCDDRNLSMETVERGPRGQHHRSRRDDSIICGVHRSSSDSGDILCQPGHPVGIAT